MTNHNDDQPRRVIYTTPPELVIDIYCSGPECDRQHLEHDGDGWTCPICMTFWHDPDEVGELAQEDTPLDELVGYPLYDNSEQWSLHAELVTESATEADIEATLPKKP